MNAPLKFPLDVEPAASNGKAGPTPADLTITVRDQRFGRDKKPGRWWLNNDPVATAWHNALSATFPRGEAFFIEAVKAHREGASPKLEAEIRAFVRQEINHTREHIAFNRAAVEAGYDLDFIDQRVAANLELTKDRPAIINLAVTMALEHYTAMMAQEFLANPKHFAGAEPETAAMWRWHAIEEIEHKGVAYDTYLHATKDWTRYRRWKLKSIMMVIVTINFLRHRWTDTLDLLAQDGLTGWKMKAKLAWYLLGTPGVLRRIFPAWLSYFLPGFHPWNHDDRALIGKHDSEFKDAVLA
ncbi:metal-dependent hydrolase [Novosphingobium sp. APW14]|jgi:predicted metal-dependent hydrolase|uniref:metal-dependent hydrolase n=1 Tax=Novosphingobium sp. APW14 TaxID=3077237 RepID=UPI0028E07136|nr:metal-dependent hydrolase [Novosphingobium sp. APW14]MDT9013366.1 metal-dependent hydrolase [Novosphingobium sp. APW14]